MDDISDKIYAYIEASKEAMPAIELAQGISLDSFDIQKALQDVLNLDSDDPAYLLDYNLTPVRIIELLKDYDFRRHKPELLATIKVEDPLIPERIPPLLTEQTIKAAGEIWRIYKNDVDAFPSVPHAHNLETGVVLHTLGQATYTTRNARL